MVFEAADETKRMAIDSIDGAMIMAAVLLAELAAEYLRYFPFCGESCLLLLAIFFELAT